MNALERASAIRAGIESTFLARVETDPRKFNCAWRRVLRLDGGPTPTPAAYRAIDPSTGELLEIGP